MNMGPFMLFGWGQTEFATVQRTELRPDPRGSGFLGDGRASQPVRSHQPARSDECVVTVHSRRYSYMVVVY